LFLIGGIGTPPQYAHVLDVIDEAEILSDVSMSLILKLCDA